MTICSSEAMRTRCWCYGAADAVSPPTAFKSSTRGTPGVPGDVHIGAGFGGCVALLDRDGDGRSEAVIASNEGSVGTPPGPSGPTGAITILSGSSSGLTGRLSLTYPTSGKAPSEASGSAAHSRAGSQRHEPTVNASGFRCDSHRCRHHQPDASTSSDAVRPFSPNTNRWRFG